MISVCISPTPSGACQELPDIVGGTISYDFMIFEEIGGRPYGTVATYECNPLTLIGEPTRTCVNGVWSGEAPICGGRPTRKCVPTAVFWHPIIIAL